jgi:hypothetical protein
MSYRTLKSSHLSDSWQDIHLSTCLFPIVLNRLQWNVVWWVYIKSHHVNFILVHIHPIYALAYTVLKWEIINVLKLVGISHKTTPFWSKIFISNVLCYNIYLIKYKQNKTSSLLSSGM